MLFLARIQESTAETSRYLSPLHLSNDHGGFVLANGAVHPYNVSRFVHDARLQAHCSK